jgi:hypothetical protein
MVRALGLGVPCGYIDLTTCEHLSTFWTSTLVAKYRAGRWVIRTGVRTLDPDPHGEVERWDRRRLLSTFAEGRTYGVTMRYRAGHGN